jgi:hypothetical protein
LHAQIVAMADGTALLEQSWRLGSHGLISNRLKSLSMAGLRKRFILRRVAFGAGSRRNRQLHRKTEVTIFSGRIFGISLMALIATHPMFCVCAVFPGFNKFDLAGTMTGETARCFIRSMRACRSVYLRRQSQSDQRKQQA